MDFKHRVSDDTALILSISYKHSGSPILYTKKKNEGRKDDNAFYLSVAGGQGYGAVQSFYQTVLHRRVLADLGANVTMEGPFALQTEESWLAFTGLQAEQIRYGGCQSELYFESEDLDGFLERLRFYGEGSYVHSAKQMPWGQRVIRFYDPDDHIIEVGADACGC